jgi:hypothetical protein
MALSAGLSILMTVFVFPYLHNRLPENVFLRLCTSHLLRIDQIADIRSTGISYWSPLLPIRLVSQLHLRRLIAQERLLCLGSTDDIPQNGRLFSNVSTHFPIHDPR